MQNCRREDLLRKPAKFLNVNVKLCSLHFEPSQYHKDSKRLRQDAVPTLFDVPNAPKEVTPKRPPRERMEPNVKKRKFKGECHVFWHHNLAQLHVVDGV